MEILATIYEDDQKLRRKLGDSLNPLPEKEKSKLWEMQKQLDSINLIRIDSILNFHGYPTVQEVGHDLFKTIWLVLQHQENVEIRNKYLEYLDGKLSDGELQIFLQRTEHLKNQKYNLVHLKGEKIFSFHLIGNKLIFL